MEKKIFLLFTFIILNVLSCSDDNTDLPQRSFSESIETAHINKLYKEALEKKENTIIVWGGGDAPTNNRTNWIVQEWNKDFPEISIRLVTDLSKFHDLEIDKQLSENNLVPDVVHLQTVHDFHRWKKEGKLEIFKPLQWDQIPDNIKDPDGAFVPLYMVTFAHYINKNLVTVAPNSFQDYLKPEYKGKLILTYPHDDDAVLYLYKKIVDKYGWEFVDKLIEQEPEWIRGTAVISAIVRRGEKNATFGASGPLIDDPANTGKLVLPSEDMFLTWAQTSAIFKQTKNKAAARLYITWLLSKKMQEKWIQWSVRTDIAPKPGYLHYSAYKNTSPVDFINFMLDRGSLEEFKKQIEDKIGPVKGGSPLTDPEILRRL